ncbi:MAG: hypothetical protein CBE33_06195 [Candidatus Pelagibacter sp. TMED273]|nr:MAG: hypothetical protein CBE33_06195 [Candidatus Pelagibacter sp. TMED273]
MNFIKNRLKKKLNKFKQTKYLYLLISKLFFYIFFLKKVFKNFIFANRNRLNIKNVFLINSLLFFLKIIRIIKFSFN